MRLVFNSVYADINIIYVSIHFGCSANELLKKTASLTHSLPCMQKWLM